MFFNYIPDRDLKVWFTSSRVFKIKRNIEGSPHVVAINMQHANTDLTYVANNQNNIVDIVAIAVSDYGGLIMREYIDNNRKRVSKQTQIYDYPNLTYPYFIHVAEGESETDEPADQTIVFPPPETHEEFMERIWPRLRLLALRNRILSHEEVHQNAKSEKICREVDPSHEEVLRHDLSSNLVKRPVGWLALQLETHQTRYNAHLEAVEAAKKAGTTPPTFAYDGERAKIETMLEKFEENLTEECISEHFDMQDHSVWTRVQKDERKITLCNADSTPGEVIVDVNSFFRGSDGNIPPATEVHAKRTYHEISTKYFVRAKRTPFRKLVTQRTVTLD